MSYALFKCKGFYLIAQELGAQKYMVFDHQHFGECCFEDNLLQFNDESVQAIRIGEKEDWPENLSQEAFLDMYVKKRDVYPYNWKGFDYAFRQNLKANKRPRWRSHTI